MKHKQLVNRMVDRWISEVASLGHDVSGRRSVIEKNARPDIEMLFDILEDLDGASVDKTEKGEYAITLTDSRGRSIHLYLRGKKVWHIAYYGD